MKSRCFKKLFSILINIGDQFRKKCLANTLIAWHVVEHSVVNDWARLIILVFVDWPNLERKIECPVNRILHVSPRGRVHAELCPHLFPLPLSANRPAMAKAAVVFTPLDVAVPPFSGLLASIHEASTAPICGRPFMDVLCAPANELARPLIRSRIVYVLAHFGPRRSRACGSVPNRCRHTGEKMPGLAGLMRGRVGMAGATRHLALRHIRHVRCAVSLCVGFGGATYSY